MWADTREDQGEACALSAQVGNSSNAHDPVGVVGSEVVLGGVQLGSLDQLQGQQPGESGLYHVTTLVSLMTFCADLLCVSPVPKCYHTPM